MEKTNVQKGSVQAALEKWIDIWTFLEDREYGGFGTIDAFGRRELSGDRSAVMQGRTLYGLSAAYGMAGDIRCREMARRQYKHIRERWLDRQCGGAWTAMTRDGRPLSEEKAVYENAFMLYGLAEYARVFQSETARSLAIELYKTMENARLTAGMDGYADCYSRDWSREVKRTCGRPRYMPGEYGLDDQTHVIEAYTNLYRVWPDDGLRWRLAELVRLICGKLYDPEKKRIYPRYTRNWEPLCEDECFGDDLEVAWFLSEAAGVTQDPKLMELGNRTALALTASALEKGLDSRYGGLFEGNFRNGLVRRKMWWCNCEAINACLNAYTLTKEPGYQHLANALWHFYQTHLIAPEGYWRGVVESDGTPLLPKSSRAMPICLYHSVRVCVKMMEVQSS